MRLTAIAAASAVALGALLGGGTPTADAQAPQTAQQRIVASAPSTDMIVAETDDNNGNG